MNKPVRVIQHWHRNFRDGRWHNEPWYQFQFADGTAAAGDECPPEWLDRLVGRTEPLEVIDHVMARVGRRPLTRGTVAGLLNDAARDRREAAKPIQPPTVRAFYLASARAALAIARGIMCLEADRDRLDYDREAA